MKIKRFLMLALVLLLVICFAGCGVYKPPVILEDPYGEGNGNSTNPNPSKPTDPDDDSMIFTVTLYSEGRRFSPSTIFYAQWTSEDKTEIVNAPFDALGVAQTNKLDGEYRVTLSGLPDDYTYDPNGIYVDNDHRDVTIELLPILLTEQNGTDYYEDCIEVTQTGTFRHTFSSDDETCWFRFKPQAAGTYVFESWVDVTENEINPKINWYNGTGSFVNEAFPQARYDGGGTSSTYSKNFRFTFSLSKDYVGNVWIFKLFADCKGEYPINVDFTIKLLGEFSGDPAGEDNYEIVLPNGPFLKVNPEGVWTYNYADNNKTLDSSRFKLYWVDINNNGKFDSEYIDINLNGKFDEGDEWRDTNGDGVYTPGDEWWDTNGDGVYTPGVDYWKGSGRPNIGDEWRDTNGNGKFDLGDPWVDENGNGVCDFDLGDGFYHEYDIEKYAENDGWGPILFAKLNKDIEAMNYGGDGGGHFANVMVRLKFDGKDYSNFMAKYFSYCNDEGAHPVTQELKDFLQHYASHNSMFCDGESLAEQVYELLATEEDMWLFACGYYR